MSALDDIRIGSLRVFKVLYEERSTTKAADRLNLSQSTVSYELKKLREIFDNPLFLRNRAGLLPNEHAHHIYNHLPQLFHDLEVLYNERVDFDPQLFHGTVRIDIIEPLAMTVIPSIYQKLHALCPHLQIVIRTWEESSLEKIKQAEVDVGIHLHAINSSQVRCQPAAPSNRVFACHHHHPLKNKKEVSLQDICAYPLILPSVSHANKDGKSIIEAACEQQGITPQISAKISYLPAIIPIIKSSSALYFSSKTSLHAFRKDLYFIEVPDEVATVDQRGYNLLYPNERHDSPFHQWLRKLLIQILSESCGTARSSDSPIND
ncbi:LysR family transcriptional regulator [Ferrimonas pelagia]|uniref:LysR family transcriptional regulator n=1 Tax=Ferrimonas pelagia TaxID=1177826 RepID=A0ABP9ELV3_9GAMM